MAAERLDAGQNQSSDIGVGGEEERGASKLFGPEKIKQNQLISGETCAWCVAGSGVCAQAWVPRVSSWIRPIVQSGRSCPSETATGTAHRPRKKIGEGGSPILHGTLPPFLRRDSLDHYPMCSVPWALCVGTLPGTGCIRVRIYRKPPYSE